MNLLEAKNHMNIETSQQCFGGNQTFPQGHGHAGTGIQWFITLSGVSAAPTGILRLEQQEPPHP